MDLDLLIKSYFNWHRNKKQEDWWAWEAVDSKDSIQDLPLILKLLHACEDDSEIAYIAAGPLSNLFIKRPLEIKAPLMQIARQEKVMRTALQAVILTSGSYERAVLEEILNAYHLNYASL